MCPSTVWHLVFHYFVWCEGTINATFTLKDVTLTCLRATFDIRRRVCVHYFDFIATSTHKCSTKIALAHTRSCFSYEDVSIFFLSYETHVCITYFPITFTGENVATQLLTYKAAFSTFCLDRYVCTQVLRLRLVFMRMFCFTRTRSSGCNERTMTHFQCKRHVSPYEAMGTRVRVRLRVRLKC